MFHSRVIIYRVSDVTHLGITGLIQILSCETSGRRKKICWILNLGSVLSTVILVGRNVSARTKFYSLMKPYWKKYKEGGFNRALKFWQVSFVTAVDIHRFSAIALFRIVKKTGCFMKFELKAPQRTTEHTEKLKTIVEITKRNNTGMCCPWKALSFFHEGATHITTHRNQ